MYGLLRAAVRARGSRAPLHAARRCISVYNSLDGAVGPLEARGPALTWYACGPTVYDSAHIGHARTYVTLDILRRVTQSLLQQPVRYCMGVTDVDDKIIARSRERGVDPAVLARYYEAEFLADMAALGVAPPTVLTRVTEHIDAIVEYVKRIVDNGLAYAAPDGVYIDTGAMSPAALASGWRLMPSANHAIGAAPVEEPEEAGAPAAEGGADASAPVRQKRDRRDFALWKLSKPGEPSWPSPWGAGRPGWHVECSAMTHTVFGQHLDVHAGGIDLAFPHHCNEVLQCNAHNQYAAPSDPTSGWVRTFIHTGHVHISGRKMSKSLKNFITVRDMLTARGGDVTAAAAEFRVFCLSHKYRTNVTFGYERLDEAAALLTKLRDFMSAVRMCTKVAAAAAPSALPAAGSGASVGAAAPLAAPATRLTAHDRALLDKADAAAVAVRAALIDDFDTPTALHEIVNLASAGVVHAVPGGAALGTLQHAAGVIQQFCTTVGLQLDAGANGAPSAAAASGAPSTATSVDDVVLALAAFRHDTRTHAVAASGAVKKLRKAGTLAVDEGSPGAALAGAVGGIMTACDAVRDATLPRLGWALKDTPTGPQVTRAAPVSGGDAAGRKLA